MTNAPLMPMATAVWLVENTTLTFKQIAEFCKLHVVEVQGIADGEVAKGIVGYNPIISGQLTKEEIELSSKDQIKNNLNTRKSGSAALDMAYVGAGRYDGYFQKNLNIWDIAAGIIIVEEAGGKINNIDNSSKAGIDILAGSNSIYQKMQENLNNF